MMKPMNMIINYNTLVLYTIMGLDFSYIQMISLIGY